ncbi:2071_t:CDS:2, partial [Ambispora leptoticha]
SQVKNNGVNLSHLDIQKRELITLRGITTSQVRTREKLSDTPAYCFLKADSQEQDVPKSKVIIPKVINLDFPLQPIPINSSTKKLDQVRNKKSEHFETHLSRKDLTNCSTNCLKAWEGIIHKYCQEKEVIERKLENKVKIIIRDENSFAYTIINEEGITTEQVFGSGSTKFGYHATVVGGVIPFVNAVALALEYLELEEKVQEQGKNIEELTTKKDNLTEELIQTQTEIETVKQYLEWKQKIKDLKKELAQKEQDYQELTHEQTITDQTLTAIQQTSQQGQEIVEEMVGLATDLLEINKSGMGNSKVKQLTANLRKLKKQMK